MASIKELVEDSKRNATEKSAGEIDPIPYFQRYALNTSLTLNYGIRIDGNIEAPLLREIVHVEREVSNLRSTSNNWQDYVPLMRLLPGGRSAKAGEYRVRRDVYMDKLLDMLKEKVANGTDKPCITGNILKDPEAKLNDGMISPAQLFAYLSTDLCSRDQVYLLVHGFGRYRYDPRQSYHVTRLPIFTTWPRNPSSCS